MDESKSYITVDEQGVNRVAGTRISMDSVVIGFQHGQSPEEIQRNFPALSLEQVYGVITYYLGHRDEVEDYLQQQRVAWEQSRAQSDTTAGAALERLRAMRSHRAGHVQ